MSFPDLKPDLLLNHINLNILPLFLPAGYHGAEHKRPAQLSVLLHGGTDRRTHRAARTRGADTPTGT